MSKPAAPATKYPSLAQEADEVEGQISLLLDELVACLGRSAGSSAIDEQVAALAEEVGRIAQNLTDLNELELDEKTQSLESLRLRAEELISRLPDAIVASEHSQWAGELESVHSHLTHIRSSLNTVCLPHLSNSERLKHEAHLDKHLKMAKAKVGRAHACILQRRHVPSHPLHSNLLRIRDAISGTQAHLQKTLVERQTRRRQYHLNELKSQMRHFLARELEGRLFVDRTTIQLRSALSGKIQEWPNNSVHSQALSELLSSPHLDSVLRNARGGQSSLSAKFECKAGASGMVAELTAGERVIEDDKITFTPIIARVAL